MTDRQTNNSKYLSNTLLKYWMTLRIYICICELNKLTNDVIPRIQRVRYNYFIVLLALAVLVLIVVQMH